MVIDKSWNMQNWPKVMKFCLSFKEFLNFVPESCEIYMFFCHHLEIQHPCSTCAFCYVFREMPRVQN